MTVRDTAAMIAGMAPELFEGEYVFCTSTDPARIAACLPAALALFREGEGTSLVLPLAAAQVAGFDASGPMRRITLTVLSALDGVGLTAAVASALAGAGIACNMVAAYHHDHVFVPAEQADRALRTLLALSSTRIAPDASPA